MTARASGSQFVMDYLNQLSLRPSKNMRQFWNDLDYKHGRSKIARLKQAVEKRGPGSTTNEIYRLKNESLALSLDFANFSADLYRRFFDWLVLQPALHPRRVLDLGCDNGIVSCFLATWFPDAEVVGVDREDEAIRCATDLANRLGLHNVRFVASDLAMHDPSWVGEGFDLMVSVRSFHEIVGGLDGVPMHWSTSELLQVPVDDQALTLVRSVQDWLQDEGILMNVERLPWLGSTAMWANLLQQAGLSVDWASAAFLRFHEVGEAQELPLLTCHKSPPKTVGQESKNTDLLSSIYHLYAPDAGQTLAVGREYVDEAAEVLFYRAEDKRFVSGLQLEHPDGVKMRYEVWTCEDVVLTYEITTAGYRKLTVSPMAALSRWLQDLKTTIPALYPGLRVIPYSDANGPQASE